MFSIQRIVGAVIVIIITISLIFILPKKNLHIIGVIVLFGCVFLLTALFAEFHQFALLPGHSYISYGPSYGWQPRPVYRPPPLFTLKFGNGLDTIPLSLPPELSVSNDQLEKFKQLIEVKTAESRFKGLSGADKTSDVTSNISNTSNTTTSIPAIDVASITTATNKFTTALPQDVLNKATEQKQQGLAQIATLGPMASSAASQNIVSSGMVQLLTKDIFASTIAAVSAGSATSIANLLILAASAGSVVALVEKYRKEPWFIKLSGLRLSDTAEIRAAAKGLPPQAMILKQQTAGMISDAVAALVPADPLIVRSALYTVLTTASCDVVAGAFAALPDSIVALLDDKDKFADAVAATLTAALPSNDKSVSSRFKWTALVYLIPFYGWMLAPWLMTMNAVSITGMDMGLFNKLTDVIRGGVRTLSREIADLLPISIALACTEVVVQQAVPVVQPIAQSIAQPLR
jgi:hypothetical protein